MRHDISTPIPLAHDLGAIRPTAYDTERRIFARRARRARAQRRDRWRLWLATRVAGRRAARR